MMLTVLSILSSRGQSPFHYFLCPVLSAEDGRPVIIIVIIVIQLHLIIAIIIIIVILELDRDGA